MNKQLLNARFTFLYLAIGAVVVAFAMTYSSLAKLGTVQTALLLVGLLLGAWATVFSFLEFRRIARGSSYKADEALEQQPDPYAPRPVVVNPPTGDPYPHHEYYPQSAGFDQGQLTSRINDPTPLVEDLLKRRSELKSTAAKQR